MAETKKEIIGLCGRAHSGKSMLSDYLIDKYGFVKVYFAESLKELCAKLLKFPSVDEMNKHKVEPKEYVLDRNDVELLSNASNVPYETVLEEVQAIKSTFRSVRHALQFIGTDIIRKHNANWHINELLKRIENSPSDKIIVDDVRFINEMEVLEDMGAKLFFIVRPNLENVTHHSSEENLSWQNFENIIVNDATPKHALEQFERLLQGKRNNYFYEIFNDYLVPHLKDNDITCVNRNDYNKLYIMDKDFKEVFDTYIVDESNPLVIEDLKRKLWYV